jgi:hypothetical protein
VSEWVEAHIFQQSSLLIIYQCQRHYSALLGMHSVAVDGLCCVRWLSVLIFLFTDDFDT